MTEALQVANFGDVVILTLNRSNKLNVLDEALLDDLESNLHSIKRRADIRFIIIQGSGDKAFSAGADVNAFAEQSRESVRDHWVPAGHRVFGLLADVPQISVAAIDGLAMGGGLELALACDIRICSAKSVFALPELSLGTVPGWGGTGRLIETVGLSRAKYMVLTAAKISSNTALDWGLVSEVFEDDEFENGLKSLIERLRVLSPVATTLAKKILVPTRDPKLTESLEALAASVSATTSDLVEGINAFKEKRQPRFGGRA